MKFVIRNKLFSNKQTSFNNSFRPTKFSSPACSLLTLQRFSHNIHTIPTKYNTNPLAPKFDHFHKSVQNYSNDYWYILLAIFGSLLLLEENHAEDTHKCSEALEQLHTTLSQHKVSAKNESTEDELDKLDQFEQLEFELDDDEDIDDELEEDDDDDDSSDEEERKRRKERQEHPESN